MVSSSSLEGSRWDHRGICISSTCRCNVPKYGETPWLDYRCKVGLRGYPPHLLITNKLVSFDSKQCSPSSRTDGSTAVCPSRCCQVHTSVAKPRSVSLHARHASLAQLPTTNHHQVVSAHLQVSPRSCTSIPVAVLPASLPTPVGLNCVLQKFISCLFRESTQPSWVLVDSTMLLRHRGTTYHLCSVTPI